MFDTKAYHRAYYQKHRTKIRSQQKAANAANPGFRARARAANKRFRDNHPELKDAWNVRQRVYYKEYRRRLRRQVIDAYGSCCACCGEKQDEFLTPDHIHGGGRQHLARRGTVGIYLDIIREGFPKDKYQVLCMNCNWAKAIYGVCPHARENKGGRKF